MPSFSIAAVQRSLFLVVIMAAIIIAFIYKKPERSQETAVSDHVVLQGATMGTTYIVRYRPNDTSSTQQQMQQRIDEELVKVNAQMSTYLKDSELSRFNQSSSTDWHAVSPEIAEVVSLAQRLAQLTDGAYDVTVGPLVNLWGFGPTGHRDDVPTDAEIEQAKAISGFEKLSVRLDPPALRKSQPELQVDLSSIAKGHGTDRVLALMRSHGLEHVFVEVGGEVATSGFRAGTEPWRIGLEAPSPASRSIQAVIGLSNVALATSGNYRNFFEFENQNFSHTIDPKTGRPVTSQLVSASVVADNCALADGIATCMMALGPTAGLELAQSEHWAVLLTFSVGDKLETSCSDRFAEQYPDLCHKAVASEASD